MGRTHCNKKIIIITLYDHCKFPSIQLDWIGEMMCEMFISMHNLIRMFVYGKYTPTKILQTSL